MFKFVIVILALIVAALAAPQPLTLLAPASSSYSARIDRPAGATFYETAPLLPSYYHAAPLAYHAAAPAAYPAYAYL